MRDVKALSATGEKISEIKSPDDQGQPLEVSRCEEQLGDLQERWKNVKAEVAAQLSVLDDAIETAETSECSRDVCLI